jgi:hypothetical protein
MEVHAPHEPIHSWRDFFIHIVTITIGLLIALGLEAAVEALHHRHQRHETREALHAEIEQDRQQLPKNLHALQDERSELEGDIALLRSLRAHQPAAAGAQLYFGWRWSSMPDAAWRTAHETGVLALFPDDHVQGYSMVYGQQALVNAAGLELSRDLAKATIPLQIEPDLNRLSPELIDELIRSCATNLNQISYIEDLAKSLDPNYKSALSEL